MLVDHFAIIQKLAVRCGHENYFKKKLNFSKFQVAFWGGGNTSMVFYVSLKNQRSVSGSASDL